MNPILLSFLCGAAFIGGAVAVTVLVVIANSFRTKNDRNELLGYWKTSTEKHTEQVCVLLQIAKAIEAISQIKESEAAMLDRRKTAKE